MLVEREEVLHGDEAELQRRQAMKEKRLEEAAEKERKKIERFRKRISTKEAEVERLRRFKAVVQDRARDEADRIRKQIEVSECCPYCGNQLTDSLELDHIYPISKGGLSSTENLVYVCRDCNQAKSNLTLRQFIQLHGFDRNVVEDRLEKLGKDF